MSSSPRSGPWAPRWISVYTRVAGAALALALVLGLILPPAEGPEFATDELPFSRTASPADLGQFAGKVTLFDNSAEIAPQVGQRLVLAQPPTSTTDYRIEVRLRQTTIRAVQLCFARTTDGRHLFRFNKVYAGDNGLFTEQEGGELRRWLDTSAMVAATDELQYLDIILEVRGLSVALTIAGQRLDGTLPGPAAPLDLEVRSRGPSNRALVDRLTVVDLTGGKERTIAASDFADLPVPLDLADATGLWPNGRAYRLISCAIFAVAAAALDLLLLWLLALAARTGRTIITPAGFLFIMVPLQSALVMTSRAMLRLPYSAAILTMMIIVFIKAAALFKAGLGRRQDSERLGPLAVGAALVALALHLGLMQIFTAVQLDSISQDALLPMLTWIPAGSFALAWILRRPHPSGAFALATLQCGLAWFPGFAITPKRMLLFAAVPLMLWQLAALALCMRRPRTLTVLRGIYAIAALLVLGGLVELCLRAEPTLNRMLRPTRDMQVATWKLKQHTALFRDRSKDVSYEMVDRVHSRVKPPGVYRVITLGSSSTWGDGASGLDKAYPRQLEPILLARSGRKVEVINGGIPGVSLFMLRVYLEDVLLHLGPDLVVLYFAINEDDARPKHLHLRMEAELAAAPFIKNDDQLWAAMQLRTNPAWLIEAFLRATELRSFMALRNGFLWVASLGSGSGAGRPGDKLPDLDMTISPAEIADLCMERRIKLLLIPEVIAAEVLNRRPGQSDHLNGQYHEIFRETARKHRGVISVPINHRYDARQTASYFIDDVHMNDLGYGYLAKIIADVIFDAGLLAQKPVKASGAEVRTTNRLGAGPGEPASGK